MTAALLAPPVASEFYIEPAPQTSPIVLNRSELSEIVFHQDHLHVWAMSLSAQGHRVLISMSQSSWLSPGSEEPSYDLHLDSTADGYLSFLPMQLNADGTVNAKQTERLLGVKRKHEESYPWLDGALREWIQALDGRRLDLSLEGAAPTYHASFPPSGYATPIYRPGTYAREDRLSSLDAPIRPLSEISQSPIAWETKTLVFYGGLGAVVPRFYQEHLNALRGDFPVRFLAIDLVSREDGLKAIRERGLPYDDYCPAQEFRFDKENLPVGMIILTRPDTHFPLADLAASYGVQIFVEKPIVHPRHLREMLALYEQRQTDVLAIDFFFDNPSVAEAMKLINAGKLGRIQRMHGEMIEQQGLEPGRAEWLVTPAVSGGGLGMDMMVHLTALAEMIVERWGLSLREAHLDPDSLILARQHDAPPGSETLACVGGRTGHVPFKFTAGKGLHRSAYYLVVEGSEGTIEINLGTEHSKGFMRFTPVSGDPVTIENPTSDIGYHDTVGKILASTQEPAAVSLQERNFRIHATTLSVELLHKAAYMFGTNYYQIPFGCDPAAIVPEPGRALTVEARTRELYRELEAMVEAVSAELRADEFLSTEVSLGRTLLFESHAGAFGFLHIDPAERRVDVEFFEDSIDRRRSEVAAAVMAVAGKRGWAFGS